MAPTKAQQKGFDDFRVKLLNFSNTLSSINTIESLIEAKNIYINWLFGIRAFLEKEGYSQQNTTLFLNDKVINHSMSGGVGIFFGDERSLALLRALEEEIENKSIRLDKLYPFFDVHRTIEKNGDTFYYCRQPISLGKNSNHRHLLDIMYLFASEDGFVSYKKIDEEFEKRKRVEARSSQNISRKTISNAQGELFMRARLVKNNEIMPNKTPSGVRLLYSDRKRKGLILNNEILN